MFHEQLRADFNFKIGSLENFVSLKLLANRLTKSRVSFNKKKRSKLSDENMSEHQSCCNKNTACAEGYFGKPYFHIVLHFNFLRSF